MIENDLEFAVLDSERQKRTGYPEAVYCRGKTTEQALAIINRMAAQGIPTLATGVDTELSSRAKRRYAKTKYDPLAKVLTIDGPYKEASGLVSIVCAGTSDLPVAREALLAAEFYGSKTELITDVGVAGIHRLLSRLEDLRKARVIVAAAGMEGALPGVIAGLVSVPVIALPTSVGYGASFGGLAALLGMLNSCAPGVSVVNIDNGFGAGYLANLINLGMNVNALR
ncbi:MAG: nickel pincer cofactor biosynthesis protein LarB [Treponema sp.]|jgi:NCAIR mutase (PurE)-related protein|nr:nickel pincer cofactor biosynthesis protein LarB [Treponema sp.]